MATINMLRNSQASLHKAVYQYPNFSNVLLTSYSKPSNAFSAKSKIHSSCKYYEKAALVEEIIIPQRIPRRPTDILKALASTVKFNPASPRFKFEDDPYLLPTSNVNKRSYALSKESGRKAAAYILDKFPDSFANNPAEPNIPAFNPPIKLDESNPGDLESLKECIENLDVLNSITIYKYLKSKGTNLDDEVLHELLELVCYYGNESPDNTNYLDERWLKQTTRETQKTKWQDNHIIDEIFLQIQNKGERSYSCLVKGLAKHFQIERAYNLFKEMKDKKFCGDVEMYNELLLLVPYLREGGENRWNLVEEILSDMVQDNVKPNLSTFNALLEDVLKLGSFRQFKNLSLSIFSEMKICGIEPSLGSYYYLLSIFCKDRGPTSYILIDIMREISGQEFVIKHPKDLNFFVTAMDVCNNHLGDVDLALKVHELYQNGNNSKLIGSAFKESIYYQKFFKVLCKLDDVDRFFEIYNAYVPHTYTPEPSVMAEIIEAINNNGKLSYMPQIWTDMVLFNHFTQEPLVTVFLNVMAQCKDESLWQRFAEVTVDVKSRIEQQQESERIVRNKVSWSGEILDYMMRIFVNASDLDKASDILKKVNENQANIISYPSSEVLQDYCKLAFQNEQYEKMVACLKFATEVGQLDVISVVKNLCENSDIKESLKLELDRYISDLQENKL